MQLIFVAAVLKIAVGLAVSPWIPGATPPASVVLPSWYYALLLLIFGGSGAALYVGGPRDTRARILGLMFLVFGSLFANRLISLAIPGLTPSIVPVVAAVAHTHLIAFEPLLHWQFAWSFPRIQPALLPRRLPSLVTGLTAAAGVLLVAGNLALPALTAGETGAPLLQWLSPETDDGYFWQILSALVAPSLALLVVKLRSATRNDRRRLGWVVWGLVAGSAPMLLHVLLFTAWPAYAQATSSPARSRWIGAVLTLGSLLIPITTAYAVLVDRVLDVRFIVRRAVQYALARYTVLAAIAGVGTGLAWLLYHNRHRPLIDMLTGSPGLVLALAVLGTVLTRRRRLLDAIDRHFFREQYDARSVLVSLVESCQKAPTSRDVIALITQEVDRAMHLTSIAVLLRDDAGDEFLDPERRAPPLRATGALVSLLMGSQAPLDVDLSDDGAPVARLPFEDRNWLQAVTPRLLVPLFGARGRLRGVVALGDKRSELPFSLEDRQLMTAVAASAALALEQRLYRESPDPDRLPDPAAQPVAGQCRDCGHVYPRGAGACAACGGVLREALLPAVLAGKFEIQRQIGAGGMGVVYRARDVALDRAVAIKVLPSAGPHAVARLRREARTMAQLRHPNLAVIHAMERWRDTPVLVLEYLAGGTLAERLRFGPLEVAEALRQGVVLADVLHHLHRAGYLHRDVKPSNIGYTEDGTPKLLDFGLVRLYSHLADLPTATADHEPRRRSTTPHLGGARPLSVETADNRVVGTAAYLPPEAVAGSDPGPALDLWGLAVTLYEALAGRNPFAAPTIEETLLRLRTTTAPDLRRARPDCPAALADLLAAALATDPALRPGSAADLGRRLQAALA